jgi:nucleoside-diphosphate-sugar epimerase
VSQQFLRRFGCSNTFAFYEGTVDTEPKRAASAAGSTLYPDRVIVFGGAGFIGSHLLQELARSYPSASLHSVDIAEPRFRTKGVNYIHHDLRKPIPAELCGGGKAAIFNLAAVHTTPGHEDWEYYWTNILAASHVCSFANETGAEQIIFTSSISVYGASEAPKDEDCEPSPESAYGRSKLLAESVHRLWRDADPGRRSLIIARPAVIYGLAERGNFTRLASLLARGRFVYPGRKDTIKSCGYVKDLVSSMLFLAQRGPGLKIYNFCYPERTTSAEICAAFCETAGFRLPRAVIPIQLMLLAGLGFEILARLGLKTTINRARVRKLFHSTNIVPKRLQEAGFSYAYDLRSSLSDWKSASGRRGFA